MSPPTGRPKSENPKDTMVRVRMDKETVERLDACAKVLETSRSEVIRIGIGKVEAELVELEEGNEKKKLGDRVQNEGVK